MTREPGMLCLSSLLAAAAFVVGCEQAGEATIDSVAAAPASSSPPVVAAPTVDSTPAVNEVTRKSPTVKTGRKPVTAASTAPKSSAAPKTQSSTPAQREDSIIGYDRLIRRPIRTLPPASSTPRR